MWTAEGSYIAHRKTTASHRKRALMGFLAQVIPIKMRVIPFFQRPLQSHDGHHFPYCTVLGTRNSHGIHDTLSTNISRKLTELHTHFPCCAALNRLKSMHQLWCYYQPQEKSSDSVSKCLLSYTSISPHLGLYTKCYTYIYIYIHKVKIILVAKILRT
jgi:hypothetical protein